MLGCASVDLKNSQKTPPPKVVEFPDSFKFTNDQQSPAIAIESNGVWINKKSISLKEERLPSVFRSNMNVSFKSKSSLKELTAKISQETGLKFVFASEVLQEAEAPNLSAGFSSNSSVRTLLDQVGAQFNMSWRHKDGTVEIYRFDTKIFNIVALPGVTDLASTVSNRKSLGSDVPENATGQENKFNAKLDFWGDLNKALKNLVPKDASFNVSESNLTVSVTGTPQILSAVEGYINSSNAKRMRQVVLDVRVYKVALQHGRDFGASMGNALSGLKVGAAPSSTLPQSNYGSLTALIGLDAAGKSVHPSRFLRALNLIGKANIAEEVTQMVLSGESASINNLREVTYLAEVSPSGSTGTYLKPGMITEGFSMTLTPNIVDDRVLIGGVIEMSALQSIGTKTSGWQAIDTPSRMTGTQLIRVGMFSGETYVYALRERTGNSHDSQLVGNGFSKMYSDQWSSRESNNALVITITPHIIKPKSI
jgi:type IVB pilus formation R64 PilN family outer membrane protein